MPLLSLTVAVYAAAELAACCCCGCCSISGIAASPAPGASNLLLTVRMSTHDTAHDFAGCAPTPPSQPLIQHHVTQHPHDYPLDTT